MVGHVRNTFRKGRTEGPLYPTKSREPSQTVKRQTYSKYTSKWATAKNRQEPPETVKNRQKPSCAVRNRRVSARVPS